uniref:(northern house mosquito) hypothetical protein n=1 Tax=Culex pipiens TaxID=7175 RepID=A0A8D8BWH6_CULPI
MLASMVVNLTHLTLVINQESLHGNRETVGGYGISWACRQHDTSSIGRVWCVCGVSSRMVQYGRRKSQNLPSTEPSIKGQRHHRKARMRLVLKLFIPTVKPWIYVNK